MPLNWGFSIVEMKMPAKGDTKYSKGSVFESNLHGPIEVIDFVHSKMILVRFLNTGYEYWTSSTRIVRGEVKDPTTARVFGVGINDVGYVVDKLINGERIICPYYKTWKNMLGRCYYDKNRPTYEGASVCEEWFRLSNFKSWMEKQDWQGKELDKDLLVKGNKLYSPQTCVFISSDINLFIITSLKADGDLPQGVKQHRKAFTAVVGIDGKNTYLGSFKTAEEAHSAWREAKMLQAIVLAERQNCPLVAEALLKRYA